MLSTANGHNVLEATLHLPRTGVWQADLVVDTQNPSDVTGAIALSLIDGGLTLSGTSFRPPWLWRGVTRVRMLAGAGGMSTPMTAQGYSNAPASVIVGDILSGAGETLSGASMSLAARMPSWARLGQSTDSQETAGSALQAIVDELGATWRSLPDGTVWIGTETWPASPLTDYQVIDAQPEDARIELVAAGPTLLPGTTFTGTTFTGGNVGRVVYRVRPDSFRVEVFFD